MITLKVELQASPELRSPCVMTISRYADFDFDSFFFNFLLITVSHTFATILQLSHLENLYRIKCFWSKINTLSKIILNKIHDIIDFDSSKSVIYFIFTDIRHTTISTYALFWDILAVPNTVVYRGYHLHIKCIINGPLSLLRV